MSEPRVRKRRRAIEAEECRSRGGHRGVMVSGYGVRLRIQIYDATTAGVSTGGSGMDI